MTDEDVLARTIWAEARGEGLTGMKAVACVVMNRVNSDLNDDNKPDWWGEGVSGVCLKPWQFSCWNKDDPNLPKLMAITEADPVFSQCVRIAQDAIEGDLDDITDGATHYFDKRMPEEPKWANGLEPCAAMGHHLFYRNVK